MSLCDCHLEQDTGHCHHSRKSPCAPSQSCPHPRATASLTAITTLFACSLKQSECVLLSLASFTRHHICRFIHVTGCVTSCPFYWGVVFLCLSFSCQWPFQSCLVAGEAALNIHVPDFVEREGPDVTLMFIPPSFTRNTHRDCTGPLHMLSLCAHTLLPVLCDWFLLIVEVAAYLSPSQRAPLNHHHLV